MAGCTVAHPITRSSHESTCRFLSELKGSVLVPVNLDARLVSLLSPFLPHYKRIWNVQYILHLN